eukprot:15978-Heterococcus_DN1.PRE.4
MLNTSVSNGLGLESGDIATHQCMIECGESGTHIIEPRSWHGAQEELWLNSEEQAQCDDTRRKTEGKKK